MLDSVHKKVNQVLVCTFLNEKLVVPLISIMQWKKLFQVSIMPECVLFKLMVLSLFIF